MPNAMYPARTGTRSPNAAVPMSRSVFRSGAFEKSGPVGVIGTNAIAAAIRIPPHATNGIAYETPASRYCRARERCPLIRTPCRPAGAAASGDGPAV